MIDQSRSYRSPEPCPQAANPLILRVGVKSDPIEYRYSWDWLFRVMAEENVHYLQLGSFFEIYQLPDEFFHELRRKAEAFGVQIASVFTAHRELGGFFRGDPSWERVAVENFRRLIRVGALLGARSVGSNPGAVLRDQMDRKVDGVRCYVENMKKLMHYAHDCGVAVLAIEPMSCLAEPPTLPGEIIDMAEELTAYHREHPGETSRIGCCFDTSHRYLDSRRQLRHDYLELLEAALPYITEMHLKNAEATLDFTFGFAAAERAHGNVDLERIRDFLVERRALLPCSELIGYLEIGGPKLGRDYSDEQLESMLRESLRYLHSAFQAPGDVRRRPAGALPIPAVSTGALSHVQVSASMMCANMGRLADEIASLERVGVSMLHWDIMDGRFVPNMPCGLRLLEQTRTLSRLPFDVHLMVEDNEFFIRELAKIGVEQIAVHWETAPHCDRMLKLIRGLGARAGVALNPATSPSVLEYVAEQVDFVLIMTVNPGFAGQQMTGSALRKISDCRNWLGERGLRIPIEVDGNVSFENIPRMLAAGADILVAGTSSVFYAGATREESFARVRAAIAAGLALRSDTEPSLLTVSAVTQ